MEGLKARRRQYLAEQDGKDKKEITDILDAMAKELLDAPQESKNRCKQALEKGYIKWGSFPVAPVECDGTPVTDYRVRNEEIKKRFEKEHPGLKFYYTDPRVRASSHEAQAAYKPGYFFQ